MPNRGEFLADGRTLGIGIDLHLQQVAAPAGLDRRLVDDVVARAQHLARERRARARLALVRNAREDRAETVLDLERRGREHEGAASIHRRVPEVVDADRTLVARRQRRIVRAREIRPLQVGAGEGRRLHRVEGRFLVLDVERAGRAERQRREVHVLPPGDVLRGIDVVRRLARPGRHVVLDPRPEVARPVEHPDVGQRVRNGLRAPLERRRPRGTRGKVRQNVVGIRRDAVHEQAWRRPRSGCDVVLLAGDRRKGDLVREPVGEQDVIVALAAHDLAGRILERILGARGQRVDGRRKSSGPARLEQVADPQHRGERRRLDGGLGRDREQRVPPQIPLIPSARVEIVDVDPDGGVGRGAGADRRWLLTERVEADAVRVVQRVERERGRRLRGVGAKAVIGVPVRVINDLLRVRAREWQLRDLVDVVVGTPRDEVDAMERAVLDVLELRQVVRGLAGAGAEAAPLRR